MAATVQPSLKRDDLLPTIGSLSVGFRFTAGSPMKEDGMLLRLGVNDADEETDGPYSGTNLPLGDDDDNEDGDGDAEDDGLASSVSDHANKHDEIWADTTAYSVNKVGTLLLFSLLQDHNFDAVKPIFVSEASWLVPTSRWELVISEDIVEFFGTFSDLSSPRKGTVSAAVKFHFDFH